MSPNASGKKREHKTSRFRFITEDFAERKTRIHLYIYFTFLFKKKNNERTRVKREQSNGFTKRDFASFRSVCGAFSLFYEMHFQNFES